MTPLVQFLLYNLLPSLVAGAIVWLIVLVALTVLPIRKATIRLSLLAIPLVKSILLLLGIGLILPWPEPFFSDLHAQALPPQQVFPYLLLWAGGIFLVYELVVRRVRRRMLSEARPAPERLIRSLDEVLIPLNHSASYMCTNGLECNTSKVRRPRLLVSDTLNSPVALTSGGEPAVIFPADLVPELNDTELTGALVHELTHFSLRWPGWCSVGLLRKMATVSPAAGLVMTQINREEEKACDDMAVKITGELEVYTDMLLKSYRYALAHQRPVESRLDVIPRLLGAKPMLTERVERLLHPQPPASSQWLQYTLACILWLGLSAVLFTF
jgi:beta-lactamase regulating signal transducer with metallopeptidase domain